MTTILATFYDIRPDGTYTEADKLTYDINDPDASRIAGRRMAACLRMGLAVLTVPVKKENQK